MNTNRAYVQHPCAGHRLCYCTNGRDRLNSRMTPAQSMQRHKDKHDHTDTRPGSARGRLARPAHSSKAVRACTCKPKAVPAPNARARAVQTRATVMHKPSGQPCPPWRSWLRARPPGPAPRTLPSRPVSDPARATARPPPAPFLPPPFRPANGSHAGRRSHQTVHL